MKQQTRRRGLLFLAALLLIALAVVLFYTRVFPNIGRSAGAEVSRQNMASAEEASLPFSFPQENSAEESASATSSPESETESEIENEIESIPESEPESEPASIPESEPESTPEASRPEESGPQQSEPETGEDSSRGTVNSGIPVANENYVIIDPYEGDWNLILVNKDFRLGENLEMDVEYIHGEMVDARIYDALSRMLSDGEADSDRDFLVCSGYRTVGLQTELFDNFMARVMAENPGISEEEAYQITATEVAIPGASEHNTGLAVDICALDFQMLIREYEEASEAQWLKEHCAEYGFILRYPDGKENITGIIYEPWHFRYVGVEAASYIMANNLTLEEYLDKVTMS